VRKTAWWQRIKQHPVATAFISLSALLVLLVILGYIFNWGWAGLGTYIPPTKNSNFQRGKTLWDWMQLLFIPVALAVAGFWFNHRERDIEQQRVEADREISFDNQREATLKEYIDKLSEHLLQENLCKSGPESEVRKIARVRTLTVLPRLDSRRKRSVLQFLYEAGLINRNNPIVDLQGADFTDAFMDHIDLHGAMLYKVNLSSVYVDPRPGQNDLEEEIYPQGLYRVLKSIYRRTRGNKPLYITENGFRDAADSRRPQALLEHLAMVHRAISEGIPVRGYLHWTLVDDFEWNDGWGTHLGLIAMDPLTQQRTPRGSSLLFGEICRANAITEEIVERYAPQAMDRIFASS